MALQIASLNSGSNGNSYYVGNETDAVLIDAGISCRETERRMRQNDLPIDRLRAVFISHEHTDHISGLRVLANKYQLPVFITSATQNGCPFSLPDHLVKRFRHGEPIPIGSLQVLPFRKEHDANDPHSFVIEASEIRVGVFTDIGRSCEQVINYFSRCHAVFLEANYDPEMLENGDYPRHLKRRISNGAGHLSNNEALELYLNYRAPYLSHLILSHLSQNNNRPGIVEELFRPHAAGRTVVIASRHTSSPVFLVNGSSAFPVTPIAKPAPQRTQQLSLF